MTSSESLPSSGADVQRAKPTPAGLQWKLPPNRDELVRAFQLWPVRANYLINISETFKCAYFETPKVACSTIKRMLQQAEVDRAGGQLVKDVHDKASSPLLSPNDVEAPLSEVLHGDAYFRFAFVRNPYSRVLSAYLDKLVQSEWERRRHLPALGFELGSTPTFLDFLQRIEKQTSFQCDIHWTPQCDLLGWDRMKMHFIGRFENFASDHQAVARKIFGADHERYCSVRVDFHKTDAQSKIQEHIGVRERDLIERIYERDFDLYCYSRDPFFAGN